jgi:hypothetical protein
MIERRHLGLTGLALLICSFLPIIPSTIITVTPTLNPLLITPLQTKTVEYLGYINLKDNVTYTVLNNIDLAFDNNFDTYANYECDLNIYDRVNILEITTAEQYYWVRITFSRQNIEWLIYLNDETSPRYDIFLGLSRDKQTFEFIDKIKKIELVAKAWGTQHYDIKIFEIEAQPLSVQPIYVYDKNNNPVSGAFIIGNIGDRIAITKTDVNGIAELNPAFRYKWLAVKEGYIGYLGNIEQNKAIIEEVKLKEKLNCNLTYVYKAYTTQTVIENYTFKGFADKSLAFKVEGNAGNLCGNDKGYTWIKNIPYKVIIKNENRTTAGNIIVISYDLAYYQTQDTYWTKLDIYNGSITLEYKDGNIRTLSGNYCGYLISGNIKRVGDNYISYINLYNPQTMDNYDITLTIADYYKISVPIKTGLQISGIGLIALSFLPIPIKREER